MASTELDASIASLTHAAEKLVASADAYVKASQERMPFIEKKLDALVEAPGEDGNAGGKVTQRLAHRVSPGVCYLAVGATLRSRSISAMILSSSPGAIFP